MCEQRFGSPLFGLVSHEVPKRNGSNMTSSGRTKDKSGAAERERERGWEEQGCLEGATAKASADVLEIRIWEVNTSNWGGEGWKEGRKGREGGRKGGKWEGGKFTVEGRKEMNMYGW